MGQEQQGQSVPNGDREGGARRRRAIKTMDKIAEAIRILKAAGRVELRSEAAAAELRHRARPMRRASEGVAAAVFGLLAAT